MPGPIVQGTFASTQANTSPLTSDVVDIPYGSTSMKLSTVGLDGSDTVKTQKITSPGTAWVDQTTYSSDQTNTAVTVAAGEQWRLVLLTEAALHDVRYKMSCES